MTGNVNRSMGSGIGPTGAGRGAGTGTAAADEAGAVDTVERDPAGAEGGGSGGGVLLRPRVWRGCHRGEH